MVMATDWEQQHRRFKEMNEYGYVVTEDGKFGTEKREQRGTAKEYRDKKITLETKTILLNCDVISNLYVC